MTVRSHIKKNIVKRKHVAGQGEPLIRLNHCSIILANAAALDEVSFTLHRGERWLLAGPNGAGKTLLLKMLAGEMWPTPTGRESREYRFDGEVEAEPFEAKRYIAYVGPERQDKYVRYDWNFSVTQVVTTGLFNEDIPRSSLSAVQSRTIEKLLKTFGLWSLRTRKFLTLSYGQRRRALVARAFAASPRVLLLDEVFNGLDTTSARILRRVLESKVAPTWIVSTHRLHDAPRNVTHVARIAQGKIGSSQPVHSGKISAAVKSASSIPKFNSKGAPTSRSKIKTSSNTHAQAPLIQLRDVDLYRDYRLVLREVDWRVGRGEHWVIVGRNGSGKSTLLKLLYGDLHPRLGGSIERNGVPFGTPITEWKRRVGFVSPELQSEYFLARDLEEVVISGRYASIGLNNAPTAADRRAAQRWLRFFNLQHLSQRKPRTVSYGQMRLALLARAMINEPELLLLDEPFTGLDTEVRTLMVQWLDQLATRGVQLILAVHDRKELPTSVSNVLEIGKDKRVRVI